jgi:uncharacterized protein YpbB
MILKILQNTYVIVVKGCVLHIKFLVCHNHVKQFPNVMKNVKFNDNVSICNSCQKKINLKQRLNLMLQDYYSN